jgi:hypothetical protein
MLRNFIRVLMLAVPLTFLMPLAHADNFLYSFTAGSGSSLQGTQWTYESIGGHMPEINFVTPTTATPLFSAGFNIGQIELVSLNGVDIFIHSSCCTDTADLGLPFDPGPGTYSNSLGDTLVITDQPPAPPVPEPSSLMLFGSGAIGIAGVIRRKYAPLTSRNRQP